MSSDAPRPLSATNVRIPRPTGRMPVYVAGPEGGGPWPGVVVIHDVLGMTTAMCNQADWLAGEGYLAAVPHLYYRGGRARCLFRVIREASRRAGGVFEDLEVVRTWLAERDDCTGRIGVIGFCLGGGFAVLLAAGWGYDASSVNYGDVPRDADTLLAGACPIVGSFGAKDSWFRQAPGRLEHALVLNGVQHDIKVYPGAGHAFLHEHDPADVPRWVLVMGALARSGYHEPSAQDARRRILAFFDTHLKRGATG